jgi:hypothetical protein
MLMIRQRSWKVLFTVLRTFRPVVAYNQVYGSLLMRTFFRLTTLAAALFVCGFALPGCSSEEGSDIKADGGAMKGGKMDGGAMDKGKMDGGAMAKDKMDGGAMAKDKTDGGAMDKGKMEGGAMGKGKMDGAMDKGKMDRPSN